MIEKDAVREELVAQGLEWSEDLWDHLSAEYSDEIENPEVFEGALEEVLNAYRDHQGYRVQHRERRTPGTEERRVIGPDARTKTLGKIIALEAARHPLVKAFRTEILRNRLLPDAQSVEVWIKRRGKKEGLPEGWARFGDVVSDLRVDPSLDREAIASGPVRQAPGFFTHGVSEPGVLLYWSTEFFDRGWLVPIRMPVKSDGPLGKLKWAVDHLGHEYPCWQEAWATTFVLTGITPPLLRASVNISKANMLAASLITMEIDPRLSPSDLASIYAEARRRIWNGEIRDKQISEKHLELALFAGENCREADSGGWSFLLERWNANHPHWAYVSNDLNFSRDVKSAWKRVTGSDLKKPAATGRSKK